MKKWRTTSGGPQAGPVREEADFVALVLIINVANNRRRRSAAAWRRRREERKKEWIVIAAGHKSGSRARGGRFRRAGGGRFRRKQQTGAVSIGAVAATKS